MPRIDSNKKRRRIVPVEDDSLASPEELDARSPADEAGDTTSESAEIDIVSTWRKRRRRQIALVTLALVLAVVWFAPWIVAHTPLRNRLLASAAGELSGTISVERASLGWLSPVVLNELQIRDAEGQPVIRVSAIEGDTTLWRLALDSGALGKLRIERPQIQIAIGEKQSNLEEIFAAWLSADKEKSLVCPAIDLEIVEGTISLDDPASGQHWQLENVQASLQLARNWSAPLVATFAAKSQQPDRATRVEGKLDIRRTVADSASPVDHGALVLDSHDLPLHLLEPFLRRAYPAARLSGWLSANAEIQWDDAGISPTVAVAGQIDTEQLLLTGVFAGRDELRLDRVKLPCRATLRGNRVTIERTSLDCDVGQASLIGPIELAIDDTTVPRLFDALSRENYEMQGQIDLAKMAMLLPATLRIRPGTEIESGKVTWQLARKLAEQSQWEGRIETSNLVALAEGRQVTWQMPVVVALRAHDERRGLVIDKLDWQSSFLSMQAAGTLDDLSINATYDLNQLARELDQFFDLAGLELAGDGWTYITCKRADANRLDADGQFQLRQFRLVRDGAPPWTEENLIINAALAGETDERGLRRVDSASVKLESNADLLTVALTKPIANPSATSAWPVDFKLQGQLASWIPRLEPWIGRLDGWRCTGLCNVQGTGNATTDGIELGPTRCHVAQLRADSPGLHFDEPEVELKLTGNVSRQNNSADFSSVTFTSTTVSFNAQDVNVTAAAAKPLQLAGIVAYAADVGRLQQCTLITPEPPLVQLGGRLQGQLKLSPSSEGTTAEIDTQLENLTATSENAEPWSEPQIRLVGKGRFDRAADSLVLDRFQIASSMLRCDATGSIQSLAGRRDLDVRGQLDYDHEKLFALLQPYIGSGVKVAAGRESRPFSLSGPLAAFSTNPAAIADRAAPRSLIEQFTGEAGIGWTGAEVYGFRVGSGELRGKLADGVLAFSPLDLAVSEGRLTASPSIVLAPTPAEFTLGKGPLLSKVRITPAMCDQWLKYVLPALAGAADADGTFSIALEGCRVPLDEPAKGDLAGTFAVHSVEITPGALIKELLVLLERRPNVARLSRESSVPFRMVQGRIYHRDLELQFADFSIRTHGSVGLDQSLAILAEMPVPPKWIGDNRIGTAIKGQTIRLPIGGTLDQPKPDVAKALADLGINSVGESVRNKLLDGLNKGLDRLFQPEKPPAKPE